MVYAIETATDLAAHVDNDILTVRVGCERTCDNTRQRLSASVSISQAGFVSVSVIMW